MSSSSIMESDDIHTLTLQKTEKEFDDLIRSFYFITQELEEMKPILQVPYYTRIEKALSDLNYIKITYMYFCEDLRLLRLFTEMTKNENRNSNKTQ